jgi:hypothetical protein
VQDLQYSAANRTALALLAASFLALLLVYGKSNTRRSELV